MPQQNEVVERKNRVLIEMGRVILNASGLPHSFWAEAINNVCYTLNRVIFRPGTHKTSYEIWKGVKPNVAHLKVFGSPCFIYKDRKYLTKIDARCDKGVFLGYALNSRAYRVYNKVSCKFMESINVAINDGLACSHESGCMVEQEPTPSTFTEGTAMAPVIPEEESPDVDEDLIEGRIDEKLVIPTPHKVGKRQVQRDHSLSDIIGDVNEPRKTRSQVNQLVSNFVVFKSFLDMHCSDITEITHYGFVSLIEPKNF